MRKLALTSVAVEASPPHPNPVGSLAVARLGGRSLARLAHALLIPLAITTAACGDDGGGGGDAQAVTVEATPAAVAAAADRTAADGTGRMAFTITTVIEGEEVAFTGTGAFDGPNRRAQMTFDLDALSEALGSNAGEVPLEGEMRIVMDGTRMFMSFSQLSSQLGKEWVFLDLTELASGSDLLGSGLGAGQQMGDPTAFLRMLQGAGTVDDLGEEEVRGVATRHLAGTFSMAEALEQVPAENRDAIERAIAGLPAGALDATVPFDAWIDGDGYVRRIRMILGGGAFGVVAEGTSMTVEMDFYDFGDDVEIEVPSEDDALDFTQFVGGFVDSATS